MTTTMTDPAPAPVADLPLEHLEAEICTLSAHLDAGCARWLQMVADFDRREGWAGWGVMSCAHWLMWRCGLS
ncbi:MAG: HNH endonuclease, partial [Acidimicrobiales bacterium]